MECVCRVFAALLAAPVLLSGAVLAEERIALGGGDSGIILPEAPETGDICLEDVPDLEDIDLDPAGDGLELNEVLELNEGLALNDILPYEAAAEEKGPAAPNTEEDIPIDAAHFPDANFRNCISAWYDTNQDGVLSAEELAGTTQLNVMGCGIADLSGIEYFRALEHLECIDNQLTRLDVSGCTALICLYCSDNKLTNLDLGNNNLLSYLYCSYNKLASLDLSMQPKLATTLKIGINYSRIKSIISLHYKLVYELCFDATVTVTANGKTLYAPAVSLKKCKVSPIANQTYTGKAIKPNPEVKYGDRTLKKGTDYTVTYSDNKNIGIVTVTVKGKGFYTDSVKKTFKILPRAVKLALLKPGAKQLTVKWKKGAGGVSYELQYSLKKSFSSKKAVTVANTGTVSHTIKKLESGKTYYVLIRRFKKVGGKKYVSGWSPVLSKKVK